MTGPAVPRISGRVIVVDNNERVLLFGIRDPDLAGDHRLWITPGGRIERDETPINAAVRELDEETGLIVEGLSVHRWWPVHVLLKPPADETIAPVGLGELTSAVLANGRPQEPIPVIG